MDKINFENLKCPCCGRKLTCVMKDISGGANVQCKCENDNCKKEYIVENINGPAPLVIREVYPEEK